MLLLGSCFAEHIGDKLEFYKFQNTLNPHGILFHPKAIEKLVHHSIHKKDYTTKDVFYHNEQWHCFDAHSKLSHSSKDILLSQLNEGLKNTQIQVKNASHIIITLGTAWVYNFIETKKTVANCHKVPQKQFDKTLLSIDEITESLTNIAALIKQLNKKAIVLITVSPVRHLKDGFIENQRSKAHLITAVHQAIDKTEQLHYFPAYEIMMDELRDYRFYAEDMIHPNATAINYIWDRFSETWISEKAQNLMHDIEAIQKGLQHRPFNANSEAHQLFLKKLRKQMTELAKQHSHIKF